MLTCPRCSRTYPEGSTVCPADGAALLRDAIVVAPSQELAEGEMVGEYKIEGLIGRGGFGAVYRGVHPVIGKYAAIKVLSRQYSSNPEMVARFVSEARAVNRIGHKNIVDIFSFGTLPDGRQYYVMELLEGRPLDAYLSERGPLPVGEVIPILKGIARAVDAAHAAGIAHRDLKPANIFLTFDEDRAVFPKLLDFGIAKLLPTVEGDTDASQPRTQTGAPMGTPHYMSPEQCRGATVNHLTDVYSFGVMVHEMLTGSVPFFRESHLELMMLHLTADPPPLSRVAPQLPAALDGPVLRMLEKDPEKRPQSLGEAVRALAMAARGAGIDVEVPAAAEVRGSTGGARPAVVVPVGSKASGARSDAATMLDTGGHQTLGAQAVPAVPSGYRARTLALAAAGFVGLAGLVAVLVKSGSQGGTEAERNAATATATASPAAPAKEPEPAAPAAPPPRAQSTTVSVTIASIPESVEVFLGDTKLGTTPGPVSVQRGDKEVVLTFRAEGYSPKTAPVVPNEDRALSVTLAPVAKASVKRAAGRKSKDLEF